jgi:hypothetical protein
MVRRINEVPMRADELAAAVAQEGAIGARRKLKEIGHDLRQALAAEMQALAAEGGRTAEVPRIAPHPTPLTLEGRT